MKPFLSAFFIFLACSATSSAITVTSPANGAQVTSPFTVVASTSTCGAVPAASMGYSIDNGQAIIEPTSFSATVVASQGPHVLHVKCWGQNTNSEVLLNLTVATATPVGTAITVTSPANGAQLKSPFALIANTSTCGSVPAVSMGYSIDNGQTTIEPTSFSAMVAASAGPHVLHVKCWGVNTGSEVPLNITVVAAAPTASDITVTSPANGAQVTSPFSLIANSSTCGSVPAVSMGYSLDNGQTIIEPTSFGAMAVASQGSHILHVKCWGNGTSNALALNVTVTAAAGASDISVTNPTNGAQLTSPFNLVASTRTCGSSPALSMGYAIDGGATVGQPALFSAAVTAVPGAHVLSVKCFGSSTSDQVLLNIRVIPPPSAATPVFSLASGKYTTKQVVSLSDATPGAAIYYTTDGSGPSLSSPQYAGPITITASMTINALAVASGYSNSGLGMAQYEIVAPTGPTIPPNAIKLEGIQLLPNWKINHDPATPGTSTGAMSVVGDPSLSGQAQRFDTTFTNAGGELYSLSYAKDAVAQNFVYDAQAWVNEGSNVINLELDNNQVISDGDTVIYAFQCSGYSHTWEYTANTGTPSNPVIQWLRSTAACDPSTWTTNAWHHVQISYSRDDAGNVTYHSVWLDGIESPINQTVNAAFTLGWAGGTLLTNFQVDGVGANGSSTLYLDNLTIYRW